MPQETTDLIFTVIATAIVGFSLSVVVVRNPVLATFLLIASFLPTAALYVMLHAPLAAVFQVLVYAGAILILFTFVVMMINPGPGVFASGTGEKAVRARFFVGIAVALGISIGAGFAASFLYDTKSHVPVVAADFGSLRAVGRMLFTASQSNPMTVSFELLSYLILAGMVIALNLTLSKRGGKR